MSDGQPDDRLNDILDAVLELPPADRVRFLDDACRGDQALRAAIDRLLASASPADDFLERAALTPPAPHAIDAPRFEAGALLAGRFRIVRLLGRGGMGEVYEATDGELGGPVAIKTIRGESAADPEAIDRFRLEVSRARAVAHPNVCRVHELLTHGEPPHAVRFLTMELVAGETLAERLARVGRLPVAVAAGIASQVASAVDEAHRLDIVHRDLKPGNIMLADGPGGGVIAKVTDFGLAGQLAEAAPLAPRLASEVAGGTDDYMAPEQRANGAVGPAADVYAFAAVVHEMLTGEPPRDGVLAASLPPAWAPALRAALAPDPLKRPASATAIVARATPRRRRTGLAIAAGLAAVVALFVGWVRPWEGTPAAATSATLVMAPIQNATNEPALDAVTDMLRDQLAQSPFLTVLDRAEVRATLLSMARPENADLTPVVAREIAWRRHADVIVSGQVQPASSGYVMTARVERRGPQPDVVGREWTRAFEARDRAELLRLVQDAGRWVRGTAGEAASDIPKADRPVDEVTSPSWEAIDLYSRADRLTGPDSLENKLALFAEAVRLDPDFAQAWMRMGDLQMAERRLDEGAASWDHALNVLERRRLPKREEYRIRGLYANDSHDYVAAERAYRLWLLAYPNDPKPFFYIARPLMMLGRVDDAIAMMEAARAREPDALYIEAGLALLQLRANRLDAAGATIDHLRVLKQDEWARCLDGQRAFLRGDAAGALRQFEALEQGKGALASRALSLQAAVLADTGRPVEAIARLDRGIQADASAGRQTNQADKLLLAAGLELDVGRRDACRDRCVQVEQIDQSARRLAQAAAWLARAGFPADAERIMRRFDGARPIRSLEVDRHRVRGEVLLARGQARAAWIEFQAAAALDAPGVPLEYRARGAQAAGEIGTARTLYARMADDVFYYWYAPDYEPLGTWFQARRRAAALATTAPTTN